MSQDKQIRESKELETMVAGVTKAKELFPSLGSAEAHILMVVFDALAPLLKANYSAEQKRLEQLGKNLRQKGNTIRLDTMDKVAAYDPKTDTDW